MTKKATKPAEAAPEPAVEISQEDAQRVLLENRKERVAIVEKGIQDLCRAHRCVLEVEVILSSRSDTETRIIVIPMD